MVAHFYTVDSMNLCKERKVDDEREVGGLSGFAHFSLLVAIRASSQCDETVDIDCSRPSLDPKD